MIAVDGVTKHFGGRLAVDDVTFRVEPGEVVGFLGPNGAGKTTTMRVLATLLSPDEGMAEVAGISVRDDPHGVRKVIGLVTEEPGLFERLTPREHLEFTAEVHGLSSDAARTSIDQLAEALGLGEFLDRRCRELSKGNRQKVSLGRALVHRPPVLLLDEPTANLDVVAAAGLETLLRTPGLLEGTTVLLSSHQIEEVDRLADHVVGIVDGRTVASGTKAELTAQLGAEDFRTAIITLLGGAVLGGR